MVEYQLPIQKIPASVPSTTCLRKFMGGRKHEIRYLGGPGELLPIRFDDSDLDGPMGV